MPKNKIQLTDKGEINIDENMCIVMSNGDITGSVIYIKYNDNIVFPVRELFEKMGYTVRWNSYIKTVNIYRGELNEAVNYENYFIIGNRAYLKAATLNNMFGYRAEIKNYPYDVDRDYAVFGCPVLVLDNFNESEITTAERAKELLKSNLKTAFEKFKISSEYCDGSSNAEFMLNEIKNSIDNIEVIDDISKYWVFRGPYVIYVDKVTGDLYYSVWRVHKCSVKKLNFNDDDLFVMNYFVG